MAEQKKWKAPSLSASVLKWIAIVTMLIDHTGAAVVQPLFYRVQPGPLADFLSAAYPVMRGIGRIAFPIFCFLLVEGFSHTRSAKKYALRLLVFALLSELPFDFALANELISPRHQNVYFTLLIGLLVMMGVSYFANRPVAHKAQSWLYLLCQGAIAAGGLFLAKYLYTDYGFKGVFLIEVLYFLRLDRRVQILFGAIAISWELYGPLGFLPVCFYNGKRGRQMQYFFYWFYPAHLVLLGIAKWAITGRLQVLP